MTYAVGHGHTEVTRALLTVDGVEVDLVDTKFGWAPLCTASEQGCTEIARELLATGRVNPNARMFHKGRRPLHLAAEGGWEEMVKMLLATGAVDINAKDDYNKTARDYAIEKNHQGVIELLSKE